MIKETLAKWRLLESSVQLIPRSTWSPARGEGGIHEITGPRSAPGLSTESFSQLQLFGGEIGIEENLSEERR